jgi:hypothetical protein
MPSSRFSMHEPREMRKKLTRFLDYLIERSSYSLFCNSIQVRLVRYAIALSLQISKGRIPKSCFSANAEPGTLVRLNF